MVGHALVQGLGWGLGFGSGFSVLRVGKGWDGYGLLPVGLEGMLQHSIYEHKRTSKDI